MNFKFKYIVEDVDRHGNVRVYFKRRGCAKVRMRDPVGSDAFVEQYNRVLADSETPAAQRALPGGNTKHPKRGTWRWLCVQYFKSATFRSLAPSTQRARRRILESTFDEPISPNSDHCFGQMPIEYLGPKSIRVLRDRKIDLPEAANGRVKAISTVFAWAIGDEQPGINSNPARDVPRIKTGSKGWHTWTDEEVTRFEDCHPIGSKARLAFGLLLMTGVRRSDVVRLSHKHKRNGELVFTAQKNRNRDPIDMVIPVLPDLEDLLDASQLGERTFLATEYGAPFTAAGFGNWFRDRCNEADLPHCSAHGLRKAGSTRAAENGATAHQLMAMFGWKTLQQAEIYTRAAQRRKLAREGMQLIVGGRDSEKSPTQNRTSGPTSSNSLKNKEDSGLWRSLGE